MFVIAVCVISYNTSVVKIRKLVLFQLNIWFICFLVFKTAMERAIQLKES